MALIVQKVIPEVIEIVIKASPSTMSIPLKDGLMPARLAIERQLPDNIVQDLVLADMPVKLGKIKDDSISEVTFRQHNHSWWFLGIRQDKYKDVIDYIFTNLASVPEIIALAQITDPNGASSLYDAAHHSVRSVIKNHLRLCDRYELVPAKKTRIVDGILILCAIDHGNDIFSNDLSRIDGIHHHHHPLFTNGYATIDPDLTSEDCVEVIFNESPERDVVLHCSPKGSKSCDTLMEEVEVRKGAKLSPSECQSLYNFHVVDGSRIGCEGDILCLALERPIMTLNDVRHILYFEFATY